MSDSVEKAVAMFGEGYNCAQSVLGGCGEGLGLSREQAVRIAGPFGGGIGALGETCGAVSGAIMALGLKFFQAGPQDAAGKQRVYALAREFCAKFKERHASTLCRELIGMDISTPEGRKAAQDAGVFKNLCPPLVRSAAEIVGEMLSR
jgi:C_GCAxxG_C_C family probable redox protein